MPSGRGKLAEQVERLPLDTALKTAVLEGINNSDGESAGREAEVLRDFLDELPRDLQAVRDSVARDRRRRAERTSIQESRIPLPASELMGGAEIGRAEGGYLPIRDPNVCPNCGRGTEDGSLGQFLGRLGFTEDMINNLKSEFQNVDIDEYLNTARDYLKDGSKATTFAKENPGKVVSGVAVLALGAGLIYAALNRDRE
jgi:hypothetical protein